MALVSIHTTHSTVEANFVVGILEAEGIPAAVHNAHTDPLGGAFTTSISAVDVLVDEHHAARARLVLDAALHGKDVSPEDVDGPTTHAAAGSRPFTTVKPWWQSGTLVAALGLAVVVQATLLYRAHTPPPEPTWGEIGVWQWRELDGCILYSWKSTGQPSSVSCDRDRDGVNESFSVFTVGGLKLQESTDANEDGVQERTVMFDERGRKHCEYLDEDQDGFIERGSCFSPHGERILEETHQLLARRKTDLIEHLPGGVRIQWVDEDGDGHAERRVILERDGTVRFIEQEDATLAFVRVSQ